MEPIYHGSFSDYDDMRSTWGKKDDPSFPPPEAILYANYNAEDYEGYAFVLFKQDGKLYEVHGSHCSCYGLSESNYSGDGGDSQWDPEETSLEAIKLRKNYGWDGLDEVLETL